MLIWGHFCIADPIHAKRDFRLYSDRFLYEIHLLANDELRPDRRERVQEATPQPILSWAIYWKLYCFRVIANHTSTVINLTHLCLLQFSIQPDGHFFSWMVIATSHQINANAHLPYDAEGWWNAVQRIKKREEPEYICTLFSIGRVELYVSTHIWECWQSGLD